MALSSWYYYTGDPVTCPVPLGRLAGVQGHGDNYPQRSAAPVVLSFTLQPCRGSGRERGEGLSAAGLPAVGTTCGTDRRALARTREAVKTSGA
ncbi:hypothetical protein MTO96_011598 [Rhipicephalus appendiculatus]